MSIFKNLAALLEDGESAVLATVLNRAGSAPRSSGARMIVKRDGSILGSVGGGKIEARVREMSGELLIARKSAFREFVLANEEAGGMGMICGGRVEVLMQSLDPRDGDPASFFRAAELFLEERRKVRIVTAVPPAGEPVDRIDQWLLTNDGSVVCGSERGFPDIREILVLPHEDTRCVTHAGEKFHVETLFNPGTAFIFGCGHVGRATAVLTSFLGFRTVVLDDREEFANRELFGTADEIIVLDSFDDAMEGLEIGPDSYVIILTRGHLHDRDVLARALGTGAGYIGMIGSRKKRDEIFASLVEEGGAREDLSRVHSPIGHAIGAETPEEIAVSIAAELVQVRAQKNGSQRDIGCSDKKLQL
ncbi:MAG: XdhC family aldehyde oxidoreductase maturation factor [Syntrophobacteraceae bacterium]